MKQTETFESAVENGLENCSVNLNDSSLKIGVAVSGGADSISLLVSLSAITKKYKLPLYVISVNHNIRDKSESAADNEYVSSLCNQFKTEGFDVSCSVYEIPEGLVFETAKIRQKGVEEAARFLRYEKFYEFINDNKLSFLCVAHNKNDNLETLLMRFLQGSSIDSSCGIEYKTGKIIRPLIDIERSEIEQYLNEKKIQWRIDSTNSDTRYLRNRIRHELVPILNTHFEGWDKAVLSGAKKNLLDSKIISELLNDIQIDFSDGYSSVNLESFVNASEQIQIRILLKMCNYISDNNRIPYNFLKDFIYTLKVNSDFSKYFNDIELKVKNQNIFVKKNTKNKTDLVFFDIIEESGLYNFPFGKILVQKESDNQCVITFNGVVLRLNISLPFCIRNVQLGDVIQTQNKQYKKVADIYSDWKVCEEHKNQIPVIQELTSQKQNLVCIWGECFYYKNWIVTK